MDWSAATVWWIVAGVLVLAELATGTFYLLMIALGASAGALAAHAGLGIAGQFIAAAVVGSGATALWHYKRARQPRSAPVQANRDVLLDIGQTLQVDQWQPDGCARVPYRGAIWSVRFTGNGAPAPGRFRIIAIDGSELAVEPVLPTP